MAQISSRVSECITSRATVKTEELNSDDAAIIAQDVPYALPKNKSLRVCHIAGFSPVPCGGTHVNTLEDISSLAINFLTSNFLSASYLFKAETKAGPLTRTGPFLN